MDVELKWLPFLEVKRVAAIGSLGVEIDADRGSPRGYPLQADVDRIALVSAGGDGLDRRIPRLRFPLSAGRRPSFLAGSGKG